MPPTLPGAARVRRNTTVPLELVWHLLTTGQVFEDLGDDYFQARRDPERQARCLVAQLEGLGFSVTLTAIPATAA